MDLGEIGWGVKWSGFSWLRIETGGGLLWVRRWNFEFWLHEVSIRSEECWHTYRRVGSLHPSPLAATSRGLLH
jgi:hypothetical protein